MEMASNASRQAAVFVRNQIGTATRCDFGECLVSTVLKLGAERERASGDPTAMAGRTDGLQQIVPDLGELGARVRLNYNQVEERFVIDPSANSCSESDFSESGLIWLSHKQPLCPAAAFAARSSRGNEVDKDREPSSLAPVRERELKCAVAMVVESCDGRVLLTRRQERLRSFPGLFVLPGGGLDGGESLVDAGLRELLEETGIDLFKDADRASLLCAWESTFPLTFHPSLGDAGLSHHHLVVYVHIKASTLLSTDTHALRPQIAEVSELVWLTKSQALLVSTGGEHFSAAQQQQELTTFSLSAQEDQFEESYWEKQVAVRPSDRATVSMGILAGKTVIGTRFALKCFLHPASDISRI